MPQQYIRWVEATINGVVVRSDGDTGLRIQFATRQATSSTPHHCNIIVTNPAPKTIAAMRKEKGKVTLKAGYRDGGMGTIFQGEILQVRNGRESVADTYVHVIATSGENGRNYAVVNKALASGHTYTDRVKVAMDAFKGMGLRQGFVDQLGQRKFPRNFVAHGMAADLMREICRANDANWFIQGDQVHLLKSKSTLPGNTHVINADTGMVWLPEQTIEGVVVKTLLNYDIYPGSKIKLNNASVQQASLSPATSAGAQNELYKEGSILSLSADGTYKVWRVEHEGDTRGGNFYTTLTCTAKELAPALSNLIVDVPSEVDQAGGQ